jgi:hypothetical protein
MITRNALLSAEDADRLRAFERQRHDKLATTPANAAHIARIDLIDPPDRSCGHDGLPCAVRRMKSLMVLHAFDLMRRHPAFDRYRESYPRRSELHQNYYSGDGDEQSAVPDGV